MERQSAGVRELATWLRIEIEKLRDSYWNQIDRTDNEAISSAFNVAKRLNEAMAEVDATLHSVDLAVDLIEDELRRKGIPLGLVDEIDEDIDDEFEVADEAADSFVAMSEGKEGVAALNTGDADDKNKTLDGILDGKYKARVVTYTQKRVRDGKSELPVGKWLSLDEEFSYSKPTAIRLGSYEWSTLSSWKGTYMRVLRSLARDYPELFSELPEKRIISHRRVLFGSNGDAMKSPQRIGSLYVETNLSAANIAKLLMGLYDHFGLQGEAKVQIRHVGS